MCDSPVQRRPASLSRRAAVLDAAQAVFESEGYSGARLSAIAARAGITKAHIYNLFRNKDELFITVHHRAVLDELDRHAGAVLPWADRAAQLDSLARYAAGLIAGLRPTRRLPPELCRNAQADPELLDLLVEVRAQIHERVRQLLVAGGVVDAADVDGGRRLAVLISSLINGLPMAAIFEPELVGVPALTEIFDRLLPPLREVVVQPPGPAVACGCHAENPHRR